MSVLDANVLVSALISGAGPSREIVTAWIEERFATGLVAPVPPILTPRQFIDLLGA